MYKHKKSSPFPETDLVKQNEGRVKMVEVAIDGGVVFGFSNVAIKVPESIAKQGDERIHNWLSRQMTVCMGFDAKPAVIFDGLDLDTSGLKVTNNAPMLA